MGVRAALTGGEQVYLPSLRKGDDVVPLNGAEFHHLIRVRRFKPQEMIWVVNGQGLAVLARIETVRAESLDLSIIEEYPGRGELVTPIRLAIANLKGVHLDLVVEKATEMGVHEIIPLLTDNTIKKGLKRERLERIAISAMKQSRRSLVPTIRDLTPFKDLINEPSRTLNLFCHATEDAVSMLDLRGEIQQRPGLTIWIGPEGDWSQDEIDLASISDYTSTGLGPRRLRAETAAIHAVGLASALL